MLELSLQTSFTTFCSRGTHYGTSPAATLLVENVDSSSLLEIRDNISVRLQLHGAIYSPDSFVLMLRHCVNLKAMRYELTSLNRIAADKSHCVTVA